MQRMSEDGNYRRGNELVRIGADMRVLLTSAGLETEEIKDYFVKMLGKAVSDYPYSSYRCRGNRGVAEMHE